MTINVKPEHINIKKIHWKKPKCRENKDMWFWQLIVYHRNAKYLVPLPVELYQLEPGRWKNPLHLSPLSYWIRWDRLLKIVKLKVYESMTLLPGNLKTGCQQADRTLQLRKGWKATYGWKQYFKMYTFDYFRKYLFD